MRIYWLSTQSRFLMLLWFCRMVRRGLNIGIYRTSKWEIKVQGASSWINSILVPRVHFIHLQPGYCHLFCKYPSWLFPVSMLGSRIQHHLKLIPSVGQKPYFSRISQRVEYSPIVCTLLGARGKSQRVFHTPRRSFTVRESLWTFSNLLRERPYAFKACRGSPWAGKLAVYCSDRKIHLRAKWKSTCCQVIEGRKIYGLKRGKGEIFTWDEN